MKKISFTKIIMAVMLACNLALIVFTCVMVWRTCDLSPLCWLAIGEGGAVSVWLGAYAWKEKAANRSKYAMQFVKEFGKEHDATVALQMAEIVLRD